MKVPSTSTLQRALAALTLTAALGLTACSGQDAGSSGASDGGGEAAPAASDAGGSSADGGTSDGSAADGTAADGTQQAAEADVSDVPDVVATVNGEDITKDDFVPVYQGQYQQLSLQAQQGGEPVDEAALRTQVAEQMVDNTLLQQGAADAGIEATDEDIDASLEQIAQQAGLGSGDEVVQTLTAQGVSEEQVREDAATQYEITEYITQEADLTEPTEEDLRAQYDALVEQQTQAGVAEEEMPSFEELRDQLAQQATIQQQNEAAATLAAQLREAGDVTVNV